MRFHLLCLDSGRVNSRLVSLCRGFSWYTGHPVKYTSKWLGCKFLEVYVALDVFSKLLYSAYAEQIPDILFHAGSKFKIHRYNVYTMLYVVYYLMQQQRGSHFTFTDVLSCNNNNEIDVDPVLYHVVQTEKDGSLFDV